MIQFREIQPEDWEEFWEFLNTLDEETSYMMYQPGERQQRTSLAALKEALQRHEQTGTDFLQIALDGCRIVGYLQAERGKYNRIAHTAYLVIGVLKECRGQGIGTALFRRLEAWAKETGIIRLELTVECPNIAARHLYEKCGFRIEGTREKSMLVQGQLVDEYYMAKIL